MRDNSSIEWWPRALARLLPATIRRDLFYPAWQDARFALLTRRLNNATFRLLALIAERFLSDEYTPEKAAAETGVPADTIRRIAQELAHAAFEQQVTLDVPWTDTDGRRHDKTIGRPVSMHTMRGISAHSNGFQTCRTLHLLQILLGSIDCPGGQARVCTYSTSFGTVPATNWRE